MLTLKEVAAVLGEPVRAVRGMMLVGAPHEGHGRHAEFAPMALAAWCEAGARGLTNPIHADIAARWHQRALRLAARAGGGDA